MIYGYIRISTDKQTIENQKFEILKYAQTNFLLIDEWIEETVSGTKKISERELGKLIDKLNSNDTLIISEISRLGRSLMEVMSILNMLLEKQVKVFATKGNYNLGNDIPSKVLAFAFSLGAEIERDLISQRTKDALAKKKSEGKKLGRPNGSLSKQTKLTGKEDIIKELLSKKISMSGIARILNVNRITLSNYIQSRKLHLDNN
jgi:putative DNA-invertase from lambdoid prophage Rac